MDWVLMVESILPIRISGVALVGVGTMGRLEMAINPFAHLRAVLVVVVAMEHKESVEVSILTVVGLALVMVVAVVVVMVAVLVQ